MGKSVDFWPVTRRFHLHFVFIERMYSVTDCEHCRHRHRRRRHRCWLAPSTSTPICQSQVHTQSACLLFLLQLCLNSVRELIKAKKKTKTNISWKKKYIAIRQSQSSRTNTTIVSACMAFLYCRLDESMFYVNLCSFVRYTSTHKSSNWMPCPWAGLMRKHDENTINKKTKPR